MQNGKCKANPARLVKRLPEENERTRLLSEEEEERLRQVIERDCPEHLPELDIALHCGMRQGEQYKLLWSDVDLDGPRARLRKTKNKSTRYAPLNALAREALHQLLEDAEKDQQNLFMSERGRPLKKPRYWWDRVIKEAGIEDFRWHDLRHTFASRLVMAGVDLRTVAQLLGHKTLQMVMRYAHLSQSHELGAVERLCSPGQGTEKPTATRTATGTKQKLEEVA